MGMDRHERRAASDPRSTARAALAPDPSTPLTTRCLFRFCRRCLRRDWPPVPVPVRAPATGAQRFTVGVVGCPAVESQPIVVLGGSEGDRASVVSQLVASGLPAQGATKLTAADGLPGLIVIVGDAVVELVT